MTGRAEAVPLVLLTDFASGHFDEIEQSNWRNEVVKSRYTLKNRAAELLPDFRVKTSCMLPVIPNRQPEVWKDRETGKAHLHGLARCGSAWVCPVCATKISLGRRKDIQEALDLAEEMGWKVLFVTLTARHSRDDKLSDIFESFKAAKRYMRAGRKWQDVKKSYLVKGSITATEMTWGYENGWHVHFHEIMFIGGVTTQQVVEEDFYRLWAKSLDREGLECDRKHGVMVQRGSERVGEYITKWGLNQELSSIHKAAKRGHFTPFQLLALYDRGEDWAGGLFQVYADVTKGKASMRWSRGLRDALGMAEELTEQELAEAEEGEDSYRILQLTKEEYQKILYSGRPGVVGEMLTVAEAGREALIIWLAELFDIHPEAPP